MGFIRTDAGHGLMNSLDNLKERGLLGGEAFKKTTPGWEEKPQLLLFFIRAFYYISI